MASRTRGVVKREESYNKWYIECLICILNGSGLNEVRNVSQLEGNDRELLVSLAIKLIFDETGAGSFFANGKDRVSKTRITAYDLENLELFFVRKIAVIFDGVNSGPLAGWRWYDSVCSKGLSESADGRCHAFDSLATSLAMVPRSLTQAYSVGS